MANLTNSSCTEWPNNPNYCTAAVVARIFSASLSILGCVFMIFVIVLFKKYQFFVQRLILWLSIAALLDAIGYLMSEDNITKNTFCIFQAFWVTYFDWTILLWVCCITFNLLWSVLKFRKTNHLEWVYHVISWGFPFIVACIPFSNGIVYGPANLLCWVEAGENVMRFAIWFIPLFVLMTFTTFAYIYVLYVINRRSKVWTGRYNPENERSKILLKEDIKPLRFYPLVFLVSNLMPLINRIQNASQGGSTSEPVFLLAFFAILSVPLQGFLNAFVYGLNRDILSKLRWLHIKTAFQQWRGEKSIGEYPADTRPVMRTNGSTSDSETDNMA